MIKTPFWEWWTLHWNSKACNVQLASLYTDVLKLNCSGDISGKASGVPKVLFQEFAAPLQQIVPRVVMRKRFSFYGGRSWRAWKQQGVTASEWRAMGDSRSGNWMNLNKYIKAHLCLFLCTELARTHAEHFLGDWARGLISVCFHPATEALTGTQSSLWDLSGIPFCHKSSNKGKKLLEVHESWHRVLRWICWHCCGLLCKYASVDFVKHKLCKCLFRDSSKCRLLAWCLETINISDVNLHSGTAVLQPVDV